MPPFVSIPTHLNLEDSPRVLSDAHEGVPPRLLPVLSEILAQIGRIFQSGLAVHPHAIGRRLDVWMLRDLPNLVQGVSVGNGTLHGRLRRRVVQDAVAIASIGADEGGCRGGSSGKAGAEFGRSGIGHGAEGEGTGPDHVR